MFKMSEGAERAISALHSAGYEAYAVGGCIRDLFIGENSAGDFDITTNATPKEAENALRGERIIETGIKHGTITLVYKGENVEITTYRCDGEYKDNRHPDSVSFTSSLEEDLKRRDFTMNALAYDGKGVLTDIFGGRDDIKNKIIRAIGNPHERFNEDALRILRGIRFSSTLGFVIEKKTKNAMLDCKHLLKNISPERIASEINKFLCGKNVKNAILENYDVLGEIIPEVIKMHEFDQKNPHHVYDVLTHTALTVENVRAVTHMRLAAFFHDSGKVFTYTEDGNGVGHFYGHASISTRIAEDYLTKYKYDNFTKKRVLRLIGLHDVHTDENKISVKKRLNKLGKETFFELTELQAADNSAQSPKYSAAEHFKNIIAAANEILKEDCFDLKSLAINGTDLIETGTVSGKEIGIILKTLLDEVMEEKLPNEKKSLLKRVNELRENLK